MDDASLNVPPPAQFDSAPAGEGVPTFIIELWQRAEHIQPIVSGFADAITVAEITRRVLANPWTITVALGVRYSELNFIFTPFQIAKLCEDHLRRAYYPRARLVVDWVPITSEFSAGIQSPAHPTGSMEYMVTIRVGRKSYTYFVTGTGKVKAHYLKEGFRLISLPAPMLLGAPAKRIGMP